MAGGVLIGVTDAPAVRQSAPAFVRTVMWVIVCGCMGIGMVALACLLGTVISSTFIAVARAADARRQAVYELAFTARRAERDRLRTAAEQAARISVGEDADADDTIEMHRKNRCDLRLINGGPASDAADRQGA
jgi:hypothetical protein